MRFFTFRFYNSRFDIGSALFDNVYPDSMNKTDKYEYVTEAAARLTKVSIPYYEQGLIKQGHIIVRE